MKAWKNIFHVDGDQKEAEVAILISGKIDLETKTVIKDKDGHYIMKRGQSNKKI